MNQSGNKFLKNAGTGTLRYYSVLLFFSIGILINSCQSNSSANSAFLLKNTK